MKISSLVLLGSVVALSFGFYSTYQVGTAPAAATAQGAQPASAAEDLAVAPHGDTGDSGETTDSDGTRADATDRELSEVRRELALLRAEVSTLREQRSQQLATPEPGEHPAHDPRMDPAALAQAEKEDQERLEGSETNFEQEHADPRWSSETATVLQEVVSSDETAQGALRGIECRSNTCRVEMADDNSGKLASFIPLLLLQLAQTLPSVTAHHVDEGDGTKTTVLYMSRAVN